MILNLNQNIKEENLQKRSRLKEMNLKKKRLKIIEVTL